MASSGGSSLMQSFSLPGESEKAAKILGHFLGASPLSLNPARASIDSLVADPSRPASALNSVPKAVLLRAKGIYTLISNR